MVNRILYWFVTLPAISKVGCTGALGVFFACSCLFVASIPGSYARGIEIQTATALALQVEATQVAVAAEQDATAASVAADQNATATSISAATATSVAQDAATATRVAAIQQVTATAEAAPTATAQAYLDATSTVIAGITATAQAEADAAATAVAVATQDAAASATSITRAEQATATAQAVAQATATIEDYRRAMPKGYWYNMDGRIGVAVGDFRYDNTAGYENSGPRAEFVAFYVGVYNETGDTIHVNPHNVTLVDLDGRTYAHDSSTYSYWREPLQAVNVPSGSRAEGGIVFLIDQDSAPAQIIYETGTFFGGTIVVDLRRPPDEVP